MEGTIKQEVDDLQQQQQQNCNDSQGNAGDVMNTSMNGNGDTTNANENSQSAFDNDMNDASQQSIDQSINNGGQGDMSQGGGGEFDDCPSGVDNANSAQNTSQQSGEGRDNQVQGQTASGAAITEPEQFRKVFIGGLSYKTDDETLKAYFGKYGELVDYVVMKDSQTGRSRGFGFVTYADSHMVDELMKNRPHIIDGRQVEPKRATPREDSGKAEVQMTVKKLFIGGLRDTITEEDLKNYFNQYGNVLEAVIMKEKESSKSRGFGFVTFDDYDPVDKIILEKHHTISGVNVHTQKALPKDFEKGPSGKPQGPSGGKGGYGGEGRYGHGGHHGGSGGHHGGHHGGSGGGHNQNMPNLNNFAQMAATFFAAAAANKGMSGGSGGGGHKGGAGMMGTSQIPGGNRNPYNDFSFNSNSANAPMPSGKMAHMMNQMMGNPRGQGGMGGGGGGNMPMGKMGGGGGPGPMRGGHGRFSARSGPYSSGHG